MVFDLTNDGLLIGFYKRTDQIEKPLDVYRPWAERYRRLRRQESRAERSAWPPLQSEGRLRSPRDARVLTGGVSFGVLLVQSYFERSEM